MNCLLVRTSLDKHHLGFTLSPSLSSQYPVKMLTDIDYADDLAIIADTITNAKVLHHLENAANDVGLYINASKIEFIGKDKYKLSHMNQ